MPRHATTEADRPAGVAPAIRHTVPWRVTAVEVLPGFRLRVTFVDGTSGEVDMARMLERPAGADKVFAPLRDPQVFTRVEVVLGAVTWPGDLDLAPDAMYDEIRQHGRWILE